MENKNLNLKSSRGDLLGVDPRTIYAIDNFNPRKVFHRDKLDELKETIKENGVKTPLLCYRKKTDITNNPENYLCDDKGFTYFLVNGERRLRCCKELVEEGVEIKIPVILTTRGSNDFTNLVDSLITNIGEPISQLETAYGYKRLLDMKQNLKISELAKIVGKKDSYVSTTLSILELPLDIIEKIENGEISVQVALEVKKLTKDENHQVEIITKAIESKKVSVESGETKTKSKQPKKVTLGDIKEITQSKNLGAFNSVMLMIEKEAEKIGESSVFLNYLTEFHILVQDGMDIIDAIKSVDGEIKKDIYKSVI